MNYTKQQKGFTLVELAIVIVIIGLLVGGVLQGQELINQAKIRSQIKQLEGYNAAIATFKGKYNFLPGDIPFDIATRFSLQSTFVASGQINPNGDGFIGDFQGSIPPRVAWSESTYFFRQLSQAKLITGNIRVVGGSFSVGSEFPEDKFGKGGIAATSITDGNLYYFMGPTQKNNLANISNYNLISEFPPITPNQASGLDTKLDDGIPSSGNVRAVIVSATATNFSNDTVTNSCLGASNQNYNFTDGDDLRCRLVVKTASN